MPSHQRKRQLGRSQSEWLSPPHPRESYWSRGMEEGEEKLPRNLRAQPPTPSPGWGRAEPQPLLCARKHYRIQKKSDSNAVNPGIKVMLSPPATRNFPPPAPTPPPARGADAAPSPSGTPRARGRALRAPPQQTHFSSPSAPSPTAPTSRPPARSRCHHPPPKLRGLPPGRGAKSRWYRGYPGGGRAGGRGGDRRSLGGTHLRSPVPPPWARAAGGRGSRRRRSSFPGS